MANPRIGINQRFHPSRPEIIIISPIRFGRGGSPNFATHAIIHHIGRSTVIVLNPRVMDIFRVWVRS